MARRERKLAERKLTTRDRGELLEKLQEQRHLLRLGAEMYDADPANTVLSLQMATALRVLLHDTRASSSLLGLLGVKPGLSFVDTALPIGALAKTRFSPGLVSLEIAEEGRGMRWVPVLHHLPENREGRRAEFQPWWERACNRDIHGNTWSRKEFVLYLANKEGGAHVDAQRRDPKFEALDRQNSMGWSLDHSEAGHVDAGSSIPASIRQITHEVTATLEGLDTQHILGVA